MSFVSRLCLFHIKNAKLHRFLRTRGQLFYSVCLSGSQTKLKIIPNRKLTVFKGVTSLETAMVHEQCTRFAFLFFDLRGDATGKLAGIGKIVNDESCSTRRALLAYQLSFETVRSEEQGPERCLEELQPRQEEGIRELHLGPHVGCDRRGSRQGTQK